MKDLQKITAVVLIVQGVALAVLLFFLVALLPSVGIPPSDLYNADKIIPAINSPLLRIFYALFFSFGITLIIIALAMRERLRGRVRGLARIWLVTSVLGAIGYTTYAIVGSSMVSTFSTLYRENPAAAEANVAASLATLSWAILVGGFDAVATTALWGWAALRADNLPKPLCYLIIAASLLRYITAVIPSPLLVLLQLGGSVVWALWLAFVLWREPRSAPVVSARAPALL